LKQDPDNFIIMPPSALIQMIQQNKDWNPCETHQAELRRWALIQMIQQNKDWNFRYSPRNSSSADPLIQMIQQNKDWNFIDPFLYELPDFLWFRWSSKTRIETSIGWDRNPYLPRFDSDDPAKQGLKLERLGKYLPEIADFDSDDPAKQGLKQA